VRLRLFPEVRVRVRLRIRVSVWVWVRVRLFPEVRVRVRVRLRVRVRVRGRVRVRVRLIPEVRCDRSAPPDTTPASRHHPRLPTRCSCCGAWSPDRHASRQIATLVARSPR